MRRSSHSGSSGRVCTFRVVTFFFFFLFFPFLSILQVFPSDLAEAVSKKSESTLRKYLLQKKGEQHGCLSWKVSLNQQLGVRTSREIFC